MAAYVVLEPPPERAGSAEERAAFARLVRDGFAWPAFLFPVPWLLWHRLWIEALVALAVTLALAVIAARFGLGHGGTALSLLVSLAVGLEGQGLRIAALRRRGWREWGVIEAGNREDAEARYVSEAEASRPIAEVPPATRIAPAPILGLLSYPGGRL